MSTNLKASVAELGDTILRCREMPRPHVALCVGLACWTSGPIADSIRHAAERDGISFVVADVSDNPEDTLWTVGTAVFRLIDGEPPRRPSEDHPAIAFRRLFDAVVDNSEERLTILVGPLDEIEALPNVDDILAALRAAAIRYENRVQMVFVLKSWLIRQQVFWLDRPTEMLARFVDVR